MENKNTDGTKRTSAQNRAIHKYLELVAEALDREGHSLQNVTAAIKRAEIRPTTNALKEVIWRPLQQIMLGKDSSTELTTAEVDKVYEAMNAFLGREFHIHVPFPTNEPPDFDPYELYTSN